MKSPWLLLAPFFICLFLTSGCSTPLKLNNVLITITEFHPAADDSRIKLKLNFSNENVFPLAIAGVTGKLYLENNYIGKFEISKAMGIPSLNAANNETELVVEKPDVLNKLRASAGPSIAYRLECKLHMEISEDRSNSTTQSDGQLSSSVLRAEPVK